MFLESYLAACVGSLKIVLPSASRNFSYGSHQELEQRLLALLINTHSEEVVRPGHMKEYLVVIGMEYLKYFIICGKIFMLYNLTENHC